jgi:hypothetical protein
MPNKMSECLSRTPVEPSTMQMKDCFTGPGTLGAAPPTGDTSHSIGFVGDANRRDYPFHDGVEGDAGRRPLQAPFVGFNDSPHSGHRSVVFRTDRMDC